jgi:protein O-GlcNAc transferase
MRITSMIIHNLMESAIEQYQKGELQNSERLFKNILAIQPNDINALNFLGVISFQCQNYDSAIEYIQKVTEIAPNDPLNFFAYNIMGESFLKKGQLDDAINNYQKALELNPSSAEVYHSLGNAFRDKQNYTKALACYQKVTEIDPNNSLVYNNLAVVLKDIGRVNEAEKCLRHAIEKDPTCPVYYGNLLFLRNFNSQYDAQSIFYEHLQFAKRFIQPQSSLMSPYTNTRIINRRLKIGYVSPDFKFHSVAFFIEPVLNMHHRERFEIFCYSDFPFPDQVTRRIQQYTTHWRNIVGMPDEDLYDLIRKDEIDILVDLAGHASSIRMIFFARKPAPIQVSWIGYPATTGLSTMDYKLVDIYTDPPGMTERFYTEKLLRLPGSFLCYLPPSDSPEVDSLPSMKTGYVTFGSFNAFAKLSPEVLTLWITILKAVPKSHLLIKTKSFSDKEVCDHIIGFFNHEGIDSERIELINWVPSTREHLEKYNKIDIGLDSFPYNGTTTTCEAMWMGVPVITLAGKTHASRVGVSLLSNIGLPKLIAKSYDEYREIAVNLAIDTERLQKLHKKLRLMMKNSPLTNAKQFTLNLETCYREMWETWCNSV